MDGWNAPQWADFDASVMSNVDEYFDVEHEELESVQSGDSQYHSCPNTPNSKRSVTGTPCKTPKSFSDCASQDLTCCMKTLSVSSEKKFTKVKSSMTPRAFVMKKSLTRSLTPRPVNVDTEMTSVATKIRETSLSVVEKISKDSEIVVAAEEIVETSEFIDKTDDENADQNCTLVASTENDENFSNQTGPVVVTGKVSSEACGETIEEPEIIRERDDTKIPVVPSTMKKLDQISVPLTTAKKDEKSDLANAKLSKLQNCLDPSRRTILDNRKNLRGKPTVLTSHARRQSASRYRRVSSNKYVSLAEAVSKFQNGTPERFRSSNKKATNNTGGPLQKVKQAAMKLTCATSPLLRCKYRTRAVSVPNQTEREILKIEEIRKNRIKPNPIKESVMNPKNKIKTTTSQPGSIMTAKMTTRTIINEPLKKIDKKPIGVTEALPSCRKIAVRPAKTLKKSDEPTTMDVDSSTRRKTMMNPPKSLEKIKKSKNVLDAPISSRRTMINPPITLDKINDPATILETLSSSRRTMMNPPKQLTNIDNRPTKFIDSFSLIHKTPMCPPEMTKKIDNKTKSLVESFTSYDKKRDVSILSSSILPESARKHTPCKKTVPTVVSTDEGVSIKDVEILHFGIPVGNDYKKITKTQPFSFDVRNKELLNKREKLKNRQIEEEEEKRTKTFHARPVPSYVAKQSINVAKTSCKPLVTGNAPFSFQQRNELLLKKKKDMFDQIVEREKQARIFHAKPAPNFKPVYVRGASAENLRANKPTDKTTKVSQETRQRGLSQGSINDNRENTAPNIVTTNQQFPKFKNPLITQNRKIKKTAL